MKVREMIELLQAADPDHEFSVGLGYEIVPVIGHSRWNGAQGHFVAEISIWPDAPAPAAIRPEPNDTDE